MEFSIFSKLDNLTEYNIYKNFLVFLFIDITQDLFYCDILHCTYIKVPILTL